MSVVSAARANKRLEQIVTQQRVRRNAVFECLLKSIDVIETFAGEVSFAEEVLVNVGDCRRVRIDAGVAGKDLDKLRTRCARERDADAWLQDSVAVRDAIRRRIDAVVD